MTTILRSLPYFDARTIVVVRNQQASIKPHQIVVWVSITESEPREFTTGAPRFPAVLDTGFSHNFGIREEHLIRWAGMQPGYLPKMGNIRVNYVTASLHRADVWLHRNQPGKRDESGKDSPFSMELNQGIVVYPAGTLNAPRLPVLGLRGLKWSRLHLCVDSEHRRVSLRTPRRFWFFG